MHRDILLISGFTSLKEGINIRIAILESDSPMVISRLFGGGKYQSHN